MAEAAQARAPSSHRFAATVLVVLGTICAVFAVAAIWVNRQALDTDNWAKASSQMLEDKAIRTQLSTFLVDQLYANVDVAGEIRNALPPRAQPLAGPAAGAVRNVAQDAANELLQRPRVQALWENANRAAHATFLKIVKGGGSNVSTANGTVTLNLGDILQQVAGRVGAGGLASKIPPNAAQITVLKSNQLSTAQDVINALRPLAILLVLLMLVFYGVAIAIARTRRRQTLRAVGFGLIVAGAIGLIARSAGGNAVVNSLASTEAVRPAVESVWRIGTSLLSEAAVATVLYGVLIVLAAWLAGPTRAATAVRRALAPYLRDPSYAWGGAAVIVLLVGIWGPTPATRKFVPGLLLIILFAIGVEALRRQTAREFPDDTHRGFGDAVRRGWDRLIGMPAQLRHSSGNGHAAPSNGDPLAQLERLADLRDRGVLSSAEFEAQKKELLAPATSTSSPSPS
jgi:hypothetical protein